MKHFNKIIGLLLAVNTGAFGYAFIKEDKTTGIAYLIVMAIWAVHCFARCQPMNSVNTCWLWVEFITLHVAIIITAVIIWLYVFNMI